MPNPEQLARHEIDRLLRAAGWAVQEVAQANLHAARGAAVREFPLCGAYGFADCLSFGTA
jgi:type I restriction enzyme R subunit